MMMEILTQNEGKTLEFKENLASPQKILKTLIAFSNTAGGRLFIGVADKTRHVTGVADPLQAEETLVTLISDTITPQIVPNIEIIPVKGTYVIMIDVAPGSSRPYCLASQGEKQSTYIRIGSTNRLADGAMIESLRRTRLPKTYDEETSEVSSELLDFRLASELFEPFQKLTLKHLEALGVTVEEQGQTRASVGGLLLFSREKERFFPDAWIQAGRFAGTDKTHILDSQEIHTPIAAALPEVMGFLRKHLNVALVIEEIQHREVWQIPQIALREAVINALIHTDYGLTGAPLRVAVFDDRIEIDNPGLLPFGMTIQQLQTGASKIRNRVIARVFHRLGLIERWGSGIGRIRTACREAGLEEPLFEEIGTHFRVTFSKKKTHAPLVDATETKIMEVLKTRPGLSTKDIAEAIQLSTRQTRKRLIGLVKKGLVSEVSQSEQDPRKQYFAHV